MMREIKFRAWGKKTKRMFIIFDSEKQEGQDEKKL